MLANERGEIASAGRHAGRNASALLERRAEGLAALALLALLAGGIAHLSGHPQTGDDVWRAAVALLAADLTVEVLHTIALVAMIGSLALGEELAGLIVGIMYTGGSTLESVASARARRELTTLIQRAPKVAQRKRDGGLEEVPVERVQTG